jgi:ionotropic glutamate receptor
MQAGLLDYWEERFRPMPPQCQGNIKSFNPPDSKALKMKDHPPALTLKNLTGAFIVLLLGFSLSLLAFLCEKIISDRNHQIRRSKKAGNNAIKFDSQNNSAATAEVEKNFHDNNEFNQTAKIKQPEPTTNIITVDIHNQSTS